MCGRSIAEITASNPARSIHDCLLRMLCVVRWRSTHLKWVGRKRRKKERKKDESKIKIK